MNPLPPAEHVRELAHQVLADEQFARGQGERALLDYFWDLLDGLSGLQDSAPVLFWLVMAGLMLVLLAIFAHAGWVVYRAVGPGSARRELGAAAARRRRAGDPDRVLGAALARAETGDYRGAVPLLYLSLLYELDLRGLLRLDPAATNREAASQLRLPEPRRLSRRLAGLADRALYSRRPCTEEHYQQSLDLRRQVLEVAP